MAPATARVNSADVCQCLAKIAMLSAANSGAASAHIATMASLFMESSGISYSTINYTTMSSESVGNSRATVLNRRSFLGAAGAALFPAQAQSRAPNVIAILSDDQGSSDLGCVGAHDLKTPNLDRLAASGTRFTNWYANAPMCAPSRAGLLTGCWPSRVACR
jgi:hypothetical protein